MPNIFLTDLLFYKTRIIYQEFLVEEWGNIIALAKRLIKEYLSFL